MNRYIQYYVIDGLYSKFVRLHNGLEFNFNLEDKSRCIYLHVEDDDKCIYLDVKEKDE